MHLNPYGEDAVTLAADLVNNPPRTARVLAERCAAAGVVVDGRLVRADLDGVREYLDQWVQVVDAATEPERARLLNALLAASAAYPRLTDHLGTGWHLHYRDDGLALVDVMRSLISVGTALHLIGRGMHRLGRCSEPGCARVYADVSRTGRKRYCSPACANRDAVRRHRSRAG